jgi:hypothetical protein
MKRLVLLLTTFLCVNLLLAQPGAAQDECDPASVVRDAQSLKLTGDAKADLFQLKQLRELIEAQEKACTDQVLDSLTPEATPTEDSTPTPTITPTLSAAGIRTATAVAKTATATFLNQYQPIDRRELVSYPNRHKGEKVVVRGVIFNITGERSFQMYLAGSYDAVVVETTAPLSGVYKNSSVKVYGTVEGTITFSNAFGADVTQPLIDQAFIVKQ